MIYAKQVPPEYQSSFWNHADHPDITITGNNQFVSHFSDIYKETFKKYQEYENIIDNDIYIEIAMSTMPRKDNKPYSEKDKKTWADILNKRKKYTSDSEIETIVKIMNLIHPDKHFEIQYITGSSQSDWNYIIYDSEMYDSTDIRHIAMEYFNEGSEWHIYESLDEMTNDIPSFCTYTHNYGDLDADLIEISNQTATPKEEITLYAFKEFKRIPVYDTYTFTGGKKQWLQLLPKKLKHK